LCAPLEVSDVALGHRRNGTADRPQNTRRTAVRGDTLLLSDTESLNKLLVTRDIAVAHVVEQPAAPIDEHQEPAPRVGILFMVSEMLGEVGDPFG